MITVVGTIYGIGTVAFMMSTHALERRGKRFILRLCARVPLSSAYGFLSGTWPFGVVEVIWSGVVLHRCRHLDAG